MAIGEQSNQRTRGWLHHLMVTTAALALVLPSLVDLFFAGRLPPAFSIRLYTPVAIGICLAWSLNCLFVLALVARARVDSSHKPTKPRLVNGLIASSAAGATVAAAGWYPAQWVVESLMVDDTIRQSALDYGHARLLALPGLAALLVLADHFVRRQQLLALFVAAVVVNAANLVMNSLIVGGFGIDASVPALGASTSVATVVGAATLAVFALRGDSSDAPSWFGHLSRQRLVLHLRASVGPQLLWALPVAGLLAVVWAAAAIDQAAVEAALDTARTHQPHDMLQQLLAPESTPAHVLAADWAMQLPGSRPPLYLHTATTAIAVLAPWVVGLFALAASVAVGSDADRDSTAVHRWYDGAVTGFVPMAAAAAVIVAAPQPFISLFTAQEDAIAAAVDIVRLLGSQLLFALLLVLTTLVQCSSGAGRTAAATIIAGTVLAAGAGAALALTTGFMGLWSGIAAAAAVTSVASTLNFWTTADRRSDEK